MPYSSPSFSTSTTSLSSAYLPPSFWPFQYCASCSPKIQSNSHRLSGECLSKCSSMRRAIINNIQIMSSSRSIMQALQAIANSPHYCQPLKLSTQTEYLAQLKFEYEPISNVTEIHPPNVWFTIDDTRCFASIKNNIEKNLTTVQGLLSTTSRGNILNRVIYEAFEEDIGTLQETEQSFCVSFVVVKDTCEQYLKHIGSQLRLCLNYKLNLIDRSHLKVSQLDELAKEIYSKYRVFLIFDTKAQPGRILSMQCCYFPNVRFKIERVIKKDKEVLKFSKNQVLQQVKRGQITNTHGFLTLDSKMRLLMIKKDDPELHKEHWIGIWVITTYPSKRSKKQFSKQDAIWYALLDFYTNTEIQSKLSLTPNHKAFLCYFGYKKQRSKIDVPEFYLCQPDNKMPPKWSFLTKSEFVTDWNKPYEVNIDFENNTIMEEREYSEISDQNNLEQYLRNRSDAGRDNAVRDMTKAHKANPIINNQSFLSGSSQGQRPVENFSRNKLEQDEKDKTIRELKAEVERYKTKCIELEAMNKILLQEKMMNPLLYGSQFAMMQPPAYPFPPVYQYPLSYSQVGMQPYAVPTATTNEAAHPVQAKNISGQNLSQNMGSVVLPRPSQQKQGTRMPPSINLENKDHHKPTEAQSSVAKQVQPQERREQTFESKQYYAKKGNISFQDSFAVYHSDGEDNQPTFKFGQSYETNRKERTPDEEYPMSPEFKRTHSLQTELRGADRNGKQTSVLTNLKLKDLNDSNDESEEGYPELYSKIESMQAQKVEPPRTNTQARPNHPPLSPKFDEKQKQKQMERAEPIKKVQTTKPAPKPKSPPKRDNSDSDDSEEDSKFKQIKQAYLRK